MMVNMSAMTMITNRATQIKATTPPIIAVLFPPFFSFPATVGLFARNGAAVILSKPYE